MNRFLLWLKCFLMPVEYIRTVFLAGRNLKAYLGKMHIFTYLSTLTVQSVFQVIAWVGCIF